MVLGHARESKDEKRDTQMQETALRAAGVEQTFSKRATGRRWDLQ